jgi:hypothetical protein
MDVWQWIVFAANIIAVSSFIYTLIKWQKDMTFKNSMNDIVHISLVNEEDKEFWSHALARGIATRVEFLGRMGMIPMKEEGKRFSISATSTNNFTRNIEDVYYGNSNVIKILVKNNELNQFDFEKLNAQYSNKSQAT